MINQIQVIKSFVERSLSDLPHTLTINKDAHGNDIANGDQAIATLGIGSCKYRLEVTSSYINRQFPLGQIVMTDLATQHVIAGNKTDDLWKQIETHIRGTPYTAATEPKAEGVHQGAIVTSLSVEPADGRVPHLAQGVIFYTNRGEGVAGMEEIAAMVTRVISPTVVSLTVFPDTGEPFWRNALSRRSPSRQHNCWDFADEASVTERGLATALDELTKPKEKKRA